MNTLLNAINNNYATCEQLRTSCYNSLSKVINVQAVKKWYCQCNDIDDRNQVFDALKSRDAEVLSWKIIDVLNAYPDSISDFVVDLWCDNLADGRLYDENNEDILY